MANVKLSQIPPAPRLPLLTDSLVGVLGSALDANITVAQAVAALGNQVDDGTATSGTKVINVAAGYAHKLVVGGACTLAFLNWAPAGYLSSVELQLVNGGAFAVTLPTIHWYVGDGTTSTTFASINVALQAVGTNVLFVWTTDGGATLYGRAM